MTGLNRDALHPSHSMLKRTTCPHEPFHPELFSYLRYRRTIRRHDDSVHWKVGPMGAHTPIAKKWTPYVPGSVRTGRAVHQYSGNVH